MLNATFSVIFKHRAYKDKYYFTNGSRCKVTKEAFPSIEYQYKEKLMLFCLHFKSYMKYSGKKTFSPPLLQLTRYYILALIVYADLPISLCSASRPKKLTYSTYSRPDYLAGRHRWSTPRSSRLKVFLTIFQYKLCTIKISSDFRPFLNFSIYSSPTFWGVQNSL